MEKFHIKLEYQCQIIFALSPNSFNLILEQCATKIAAQFVEKKIFWKYI